MSNPESPFIERRPFVKAIACTALSASAVFTSGCALFDEKTATAKALVGYYELSEADGISADVAHAFKMRIVSEFKSDGTGIMHVFQSGEPSQEAEFSWEATGRDEAKLTANSTESTVKIQDDVLEITSPDDEVTLWDPITESELDAALAKDSKN